MSILTISAALHGIPGESRVRTPLSDISLFQKFLHRQDRISLFNWLTFLMKRGLHFASKLNSTDFQNVIVFEYPPMNCSPLLAKQSLPREKHVAFFVRSNLRQKRSTVLSEPKFGPPSQKFQDPPLGNTITGRVCGIQG